MPTKPLSPLALQRRKERTRRIVAHLKKLFPKAKIALRYRTNWELLVAVVLSAQCTDKKVNEVTEKLFQKYCSFNDYVNADPKEFEQDVRPTGFYRNKSKNILRAAKIVKEKFGENMPKTMEELLTLPGVARKTANIILGNAYGIVEGVAVDTHVKRLTYRWGLTDEKDPEKIERDLMQILPKSEWFAFSCRVIDYGRTYCPAKPHNHATCPLRSFDRPVCRQAGPM